MLRYFLLVSALAAVSAQAQTAHVAFLHGFNSDPTVWTQTRASIGARFNVTTSAPEYSSNENIIDISRNQVLPHLQDNSILIGHSMGGLIAREINLTQPHKVRGIISVGTPHQGSALAGNVRHAAGFIADEAGLIEYPFTNLFVGVIFGDYSDRNWSLNEILSFTAALVLRGAGEVFQQIWDASRPPNRDLEPNSAFLRGLNGNPRSVPAPGQMFTIHTVEDHHAVLRLVGMHKRENVEETIDALNGTVGSYGAMTSIATQLQHYYMMSAFMALQYGCSTYRLTCHDPLNPYYASSIEYDTSVWGADAFTVRMMYYEHLMSQSDQWARVAHASMEAAGALNGLDWRWREEMLERPEENLNDDCSRDSGKDGRALVGGDVIVPCSSQRGVPGLDRRYQLRGDRQDLGDPGAHHLEQTHHAGVQRAIDRALREMRIQ
jgi:pimeloyl-ACP methyl ester carboxylesterase